MPFARIGLSIGKSALYHCMIGEVVYDAMLDALNVPEDDRYQVINKDDPENLFIDPGYLGINRTGDCVVIQLTFNARRGVE